MAYWPSAECSSKRARLTSGTQDPVARLRYVIGGCILVGVFARYITGSPRPTHPHQSLLLQERPWLSLRSLGPADPHCTF